MKFVHPFACVVHGHRGPADQGVLRLPLGEHLLRADPTGASPVAHVGQVVRLANNHVVVPAQPHSRVALDGERVTEEATWGVFNLLTVGGTVFQLHYGLGLAEAREWRGPSATWEPLTRLPRRAVLEESGRMRRRSGALAVLVLVSSLGADHPLALQNLAKAVQRALTRDAFIGYLDDVRFVAFCEGANAATMSPGLRMLLTRGLSVGGWDRFIEARLWPVLMNVADSTRIGEAIDTALLFLASHPEPSDRPVVLTGV